MSTFDVIVIGAGPAESGFYTSESSRGTSSLPLDR